MKQFSFLSILRAHLANNENKYFEFKSVIFPSPSMLSYQPADFNLKGFPQVLN